MDLGSLPDIANQFYAAAQVVLPMLHHGFDVIADNGANVWAGLTQHGAMSAGERSFQLFKVGVATLGLSASLSTANVEAALACAVTDCEAVMEIAKAGAHARHLQP